MFNKTKLKFDDIFEGKLTDEEVRSYLIELYEKGETAADIAAAASAMREHSILLPIPYHLETRLIDNCGTGGDKSNSFNVSTTVSLLLAACGCYVAKHGNRSITSNSGSADMLEALGVNLSVTLEKQAIMLEDTGFIFMFAVNHHPAMKNLMPIRKSIPHRTIFNILGPLTNPAGAVKQLIGVFDKSYIHKMVEALKLLGAERAMVVSSADGLDEISISDITYATKLENGIIEDFIIDPRDYGFEMYSKDDIIGGDARLNAQITRDILEGKITGAKLDIVLLNAGAALEIDGMAKDIKEGIEIARQAILSGKAKAKLDQIIEVSKVLM
ncbi:MAG: anthranilate phosphoribosyltransferase [Arcobacteraceae bacterium]|jgi:anthranilate phosphoribosyltransferase|nr:anthranilate phosphoribosyltransferase [Arcobacteraceae bacterium]